MNENNENEDLELQALQRQLDDAFETTRPRAGFEADLWSRMQARRPFRQRVTAYLAGVVGSVRQVPAVPAAAVAVVLVLAIGVGVLTMSGIRPGGSSSTAGALRAQSGSTRFNAGAASFGRLPSPALRPAPSADTSLPKATSPGAAGLPAYQVYLGPANLVWAGQLHLWPATASVFRYAEPSPAAADQFAASLGASRQAGSGAGALGSYTGDGFVLGIVGSSQALDREPFFFITPDRSRLPAPGATPADTASAFLDAHKLLPSWPYQVVVGPSDGLVRVTYLRQFFFAPVDQVAFLVDGLGERYGLDVDLRDGQPLQAAGPLPSVLDSADYPIISGDQAVRTALASRPAAAASIEPIPTVNLTNVELVYALAFAGSHGFYEPAFLFSGTFTYNGAVYVKRVLVPAVDPSQRS